jgi:hypothetical protein
MPQKQCPKYKLLCSRVPGQSPPKAVTVAIINQYNVPQDPAGYLQLEKGPPSSEGGCPMSEEHDTLARALL